LEEIGAVQSPNAPPCEALRPRCVGFDLMRRLRSFILAILTLAAAASVARSQTSHSDIAVPPAPLFTISSYMGRCLSMATSIGKEQAVGVPEPALVIADCDGSVRQQFRVEELDAGHHVRLGGAGACVEAASATEGAAVTLKPCSASPMQIFDLDGDSIILDLPRSSSRTHETPDWDLVVQLKDSLTQAGTPVVLGRRLTNDVEFWDFISLDNPPRPPTTGFETVSESSSLPAALAPCLENKLMTAQPNTVIQIPPDELITSGDIPDGLDHLIIPEGVTLRGDRRGVLEGPQVWITSGHNKNGSDYAPGAFILQALWTRITGLRIRGPGRDPHGQKPPMNGVSMVVQATAGGQYFSELVDHNDISDWGVAGVNLWGTDTQSNDENCPVHPPSGPQPAYVMHNYIHDNLQNGFGGSEAYGLAAGMGAYPLVFANTFQKNGTSLTQDGQAQSGYVAVDNLFLSGNVSVDADVHGASPNSHDGGTAGMGAQVVGNTFLRNDGPGKDLEHANFSLRGIPCSGVPALFVGNVTLQSAQDAVIAIPEDGSSGGGTAPWYVAPPNRCVGSPPPSAAPLCGPPLASFSIQARPHVPYLNVDSKFSVPDPTQTFLVGNFDGPGLDDVFMATGAAWYYSPGGNAEWRFLSAKTETADTLLIGDFDGDGRADVFRQVGDDWYVSWGGRSDWKLLSSNHRVNMPTDKSSPDRGIVDYVIGNFVSGASADVFLADGQTWWVSEGGVGPFEAYATSSFKRQDLAFGHFDGSGKTEVAGVVANQWMYVPSEGTRQWTPLRSKLSNTMNGLFAADFKHDGITDIALEQGGDWGVSLSARGNFQKVPWLSTLTDAIAIGHFSEDRPGADILTWFGNAFYLTSYYVATPQQQSRQDMR
jgi:hypothetical protein